MSTLTTIYNNTNTSTQHLTSAFKLAAKTDSYNEIMFVVISLFIKPFSLFFSSFNNEYNLLNLFIFNDFLFIDCNSLIFYYKIH